MKMDEYLEGILNRGDSKMEDAERNKKVPLESCDNCEKKGVVIKYYGNVKLCLTCASAQEKGENLKVMTKSLDEKLLKDKESLLPGKGISYHQFKEPDYRILRTFDNPKQDTLYTIEISTDELTSLCPLTGFPDFYHLTIKYVPDKKCVESKSVKFYFHSFRDAGMFIETLANRIADDWVKICKPKFVKVEIRMNPRGGIPITVRIVRKKEE